ncbi:2-hydroxyacid dehydrogenase [Paracoccus fistulariae]|uniref:D-glycerate dehydrogenase n=1 Tax=Paracoccus fistulariae TaxID=658446 RepID=A0ABY7SIX4_9RHOB|nr:D-glycerate dehydrogenase [Paracoccus fistulariae]MDB6180822.1 D-glycerate dehydrogenase [Paracoccus fistulariae]WCR06958.1 D-glycerate dehydrogenase [Paracoccus fistulariae]
MKLLVTRPMTARATRAILDRFQTDFHENRPLTEAEAAQAMRDYDAIIPTLGDAFSARAFQGDLRCKILANFGAGYNHIDIAAAREAGITVTNTPDVVTDATADIALTLILMTMRRASEGEALLRAGKWTGWHPTQLLGGHVTGATVGIIGMGRIGQAIARRCHFGFGMKVVFFNRSTVTGLDFPARQIPDLHDMLHAADVAVVAVPGGAGTRHLIAGPELQALGPDGYLVNIARGDVVAEAPLIAALTDGTIAGVGLDVYEREPLVPQALLDAPNATLLPHLGTATDEVRTNMALRALQNVIAFSENRSPEDVVS